MAEVQDISRVSRRIFSGLSGSYDQVLDYATLFQDRRWKTWVLKEARLTAGMKVLDLACGTCVLEESMRRDVELVGLDLSWEMLAVGRSKHLILQDSLILSDAQCLPFRDSSFDAILSCYLVKYCDPKRLVSEASRVLRPGGVIVLYDFVRPRGNFWPANAMYAYGGLRMAGKLLELKGAKNSYTFAALPEVVENRPWEVGFAETLEGSRFSSVRERLLSGGVTMGFSAVRNAR